MATSKLEINQHKVANMESYQNQYGAVEQTRTDAYGNPVPVGTDEYGNPIATEQRGHTLGGMLHRSGSSSSSSSEDDGQGGRRKKEKGKGMKDKIKEKLPGHHNKPDHATSTTVPGGYNSSATTTHDQEHKGILDKIKDKLPGSHHNH